MNSKPDTGECFAADAGDPGHTESANLAAHGAPSPCYPPSENQLAICETHPSRKVTLLGPSLGQYQGHDIPEWYQTADGRRATYVGLCADQLVFEGLAEGQSMLAPGLIYLDDKLQE